MRRHLTESWKPNRLEAKWWEDKPNQTSSARREGKNRNHSYNDKQLEFDQTDSDALDGARRKWEDKYHTHWQNETENRGEKEEEKKKKKKKKQDDSSNNNDNNNNKNRC